MHMRQENVTASAALPFGNCHHDVSAFLLTLVVQSLMFVGNVTLLTILKRTYGGSRMDLVVLNQALIDSVYTFVFPLAMVDTRRDLRDLHGFIVFKVVEDSLLTLSVLAVVLVNVHKYLHISGMHSTYAAPPRKLMGSCMMAAWVLVPAGFAVRNSYLRCVPNNPCALSYWMCLAAADGTGEIASIVFYIGTAMLIIVLNVRLVIIALDFQNVSSFSRRLSTDFSNRNPRPDNDACRKTFQGSRIRRRIRILTYPLLTSLLLLCTVVPFWTSMALCQLNLVCLDRDHSLFILMRLHSMVNPFCTIMTHRKYREEFKQLCKLGVPASPPSNPNRRVSFSDQRNHLVVQPLTNGTRCHSALLIESTPVILEKRSDSCGAIL